MCAFPNTLTIGTPFRCVPVALQQWEKRCRAFLLEMIPSAQLTQHPSRATFSRTVLTSLDELLVLLE